ncbi:hypothetical protein K439DRAFT_855909 [Ramaria rubella]|nr:hypothetical protein K439DRAFT_855909 [Ramaria rubella]
MAGGESGGSRIWSVYVRVALDRRRVCARVVRCGIEKTALGEIIMKWSGFSSLADSLYALRSQACTSFLMHGWMNGTRCVVRSFSGIESGARVPACWQVGSRLGSASCILALKTRLYLPSARGYNILRRSGLKGGAACACWVAVLRLTSLP